MSIDFKLQDNGQWTFHHQGRFYQVNKLGKLISELILDGMTNEEIQGKLFALGYKEVGHDEIQTLRKSLSQFRKRSTRESTIKMRATIVDLRKYTKLLKRLNFLFDIKTVVIILVSWLGLIFVNREEILNINRYSFYQGLTEQPYLFFIYALVSFVIILIHELGHAVSSMKFGVAPKEIGFGFYLYFPVFFTDVSMSWLASRKQRIVIDLSGFYFQIVSMTILLLADLVFNFSTILIQVIIIDNIFIIIYNLNPLFRFDGYWLFSDLFKIPNLRDKSLLAIPDLIFNIVKSRNRKPKFRFSIAVYLYSIVSNIFITIMVALFCLLAIHYISDFVQNIFFGDMGFYNILWGLARILLISLGVYFSTVTLFQKINTTINYAIQLFRKDKEIRKEGESDS